MSPASAAAPVGRLEALLSLDTRALAALRVGLALVLLVDVLHRLPVLGTFVTDGGVLPRALLLELNPSVHLFPHLWGGSLAWAVGLHLVLLGAGLALLLGWRTRAATALCWLLLSSLHARNPLILAGGDSVLRVFLFWGCFLPLGARLSLDARGRPRPPDRLFTPATAVLLLQLALIYLDTAGSKLHPAWTTEGTALAMALSLDRLATPLGVAALAWPGLLRLGSLATVPLEALAGLLPFLPWRTRSVRNGLVATMWAFHLGIALTMRVGLFSWSCMAAWLALLSPRGEHPGDPEWRPAPWSGPAAALAFLAVLLGLVHANRPAATPFLAPLQAGLRTAGLSQNWVMFSPRPPEWDHWFVVEQHLGDGRSLDLFTGAPPSEAEPELVSAHYPHERWRQLLGDLGARLDKPVGARLGEAVATWACGEPPDGEARVEAVVLRVHRQRVEWPEGVVETEVIEAPRLPCP